MLLRCKLCRRKTISGPMAWDIHLPNILLELWSDRRRSAGLLLRGLEAARINACRLAANQRQLRT
jgi:hypothetical protein